MDHDHMFCPRCGSSDQMPDSYCRQCGTWLPDLNSGKRVRKPASREHNIRKMRILQGLSMALTITSLVLIVSYIAFNDDRDLLGVAVVCTFLVSVYQVIAFFLGSKLLIPRKSEPLQPSIELGIPDRQVLAPADTTNFVSPGSVVDDTTERLEPEAVRVKRRGN